MPFTIDDLNYDKDSKERMPWEHYLELYAKADPKEIASRLSIPYDEEAKEFTLTFLGSEYKITYPDFQVKHVADEKKCYPLEDMIYAKILTIRFLLNGSASVGTGRFKTYREMPWGEVYLRQFDGRCIKRLAFTYGNRLDDFRLVMDHMKCTPVKFGDVAYELSIYPGYQGPVLHTGAAIDKEICFLQVLDIGCSRFPVMGFCAGRDHVCHLRFITADFDGKIIHGIKTGHYLQFLPVRILCFNLSTEFF